MFQVFSWGNGKRGQLGLGTHKDHTTPQFVEDLGSRKVQHVSVFVRERKSSICPRYVVVVITR